MLKCRSACSVKGTYRKEIDERKMYLTLQAERREMLPELTTGLSAAAALAVKNDVEAPFKTEAFIAEVVEMLQQLCEGDFPFCDAVPDASRGAVFSLPRADAIAARQKSGARGSALCLDVKVG